MYVFRFEDENGCGPFRNGHDWAFKDASYKKGGKKINPGEMPAPCTSREKGSKLQKYVDDHLYKQMKEVFCFYEFSQIVEFFGCKKGLQAMKKHGTELYVYEVDEKYVIKGNHQAVFDKKKGTKIGILTYNGVRNVLETFS